MQQETKSAHTLYKQVRAIRGGISEISRRTNVRREWVYMVLVGRGKSARIIAAAKKLISEPKNQKQINRHHHGMGSSK